MSARPAQIAAATCAILVTAGAAVTARGDQQLAASSATSTLTSPPLTEEVYASTVARSAGSENRQAVLDATR